MDRATLRQSPRRAEGAAAGTNPAASAPAVLAPACSSRFRAISDDSRKDRESIAFLAGFDEPTRAEWMRRIGWIRLPDRLAENQLLQPEAARFDAFLDSWRRLRDTGEVAQDELNARTFAELRAAWFTPGAAEPADIAGAIAGYDGYLGALDDYTRRDLIVPTLAEHDRMLGRLSGNMLQVLPWLRPSQRPGVYAFGALDQFWNNLRDLEEDRLEGFCFLPLDVLSRFGLRRAEVLDGSAYGRPGWRPMMRFWLDAHLPRLRRRAARFGAGEPLHPSLEAMRVAFLRRQERLERLLCTFELHPVRFTRAWRALLDGAIAAGPAQVASAGTVLSCDAP